MTQCSPPASDLCVSPVVELAIIRAGPSAVDSIRRIVTRFAAALRVTCTIVSMIVASVTFDQTVEVCRVTAALALMAVSTVILAVLLLRRPAARGAVYLDVATTVLVCALQGMLLPQNRVASGVSWIAAVASVCVIVSCLILPASGAVCASLAVAGSWATGSTLGTGVDAEIGVMHLTILGIQGAVTIMLVRRLYHIARSSDRDRDRDRDRGVDDPGVRLDYALVEPADRIDPLIRVRRDLTRCEVPARVAMAMKTAVAEALVNVAKHAEVDSAVLRLRSGAYGVIVEVTDRGAGFDPTAAPPDGGGLRGKIGRPINDIDGWAQVRAAVGAGCTVTLGWQCAASRSALP